REIVEFFEGRASGRRVHERWQRGRPPRGGLHGRRAGSLLPKGPLALFVPARQRSAPAPAPVPARSLTSVASVRSVPWGAPCASPSSCVASCRSTSRRSFPESRSARASAVRVAASRSGARPDRKSTRLNSSHASTSPAPSRHTPPFPTRRSSDLSRSRPGQVPHLCRKCPKRSLGSSLRVPFQLRRQLQEHLPTLVP